MPMRGTHAAHRCLLLGAWAWPILCGSSCCCSLCGARAGALRDRNLVAARPQVLPAATERGACAGRGCDCRRADRERIVVRLRDVGAFVLCALIAATTTPMQAVLFVIVAIGATGALAMHGASLAVVGVLLPTLIHVSLFTLLFMTLGAYRSGCKVQWVLVALYLTAITLILVAPPSAETLIPSFAKAGEDYIANVAPALGRLLGIPGCGSTRGSPACSRSSTPTTTSTGSLKPRSSTGIG